ncbi:MAG: type III-B CRISPR-associated protein Cas10/Cmr2 [Thauera sp.]|jgi:CRISPR-associated protein Cmr2
MTDYVLILSLGPVQGFIAAARRSRDLWSGSWLLSEISKAAALTLQSGGARLIFPAPGSDLAPGSDFSVGNKVQAVVSADGDDVVRDIARAAAHAARMRFIELALAARSRLPSGTALREDVWQSQLDDYVESFAAWAMVGKAGYGEAVRLATDALAARKATRDFAPSARSGGEAPFFGLPKSSLDGARETVLPEGKLAVRTRLRLGLSRSEQLDCAGIIKRLAGEVEQFTPLTRIAAHSWVEGLSREAIGRLNSAYEPLVQAGVATRVRGNTRFALLPFDGQFLYPSRLDVALVEAQGDAELSALLQVLRNELKPLWRQHGEPCPYFVILLADGDRMGALLNEVSSLEHHVRITEALSVFAGEVARRVREFDGHAVYAGGDDVFAFLPLHTALACADALQQDFAQALQAVADELGARNYPTLSVGLGIGHMLEPLGDLRALASRAEKHAKGDLLAHKQRRNALAIILRTRANSETRVRLRWDDSDAQNDFSTWLTCYVPPGQREQGDTTPKTFALPSRIAYDTRAVHQRTAFALHGDAPEPGIAMAEFARLLMRARTEQGGTLDSDLKERLQSCAERHGLELLADQLLVARWLSARNARDLGERQ